MPKRKPKAKAKSAPRSKFLAWYTAQFGPRVYSGEFSKLTDRELHEVIDTGRRAEYELRMRQRWDDRKRVAGYAWFGSTAHTAGAQHSE